MTDERVGTAVRQHTEGWVEPVGRIGLATQGVLYAVVGLLALQVASGRNDQADQRGAIEAVASQSFGRLLLFVLTIGLALHCCWRLVLAARGTPGDDDAKQVVKRLADLGRGLLYGSFTVLAAGTLIDARDATGTGGGKQQEAVGTVLDWPAGELIVAAFGLGVVAAGVWHASKCVTRSFLDSLDLDGRSERTRTVVTVLGSVGYLARGVVFGLVGWFLVQAALDHDPSDSGGIDNALKRLVASDHGPQLLRLTAIGLIVFGVYRVVDAWLRKRSDVTYP